VLSLIERIILIAAILGSTGFFFNEIRARSRIVRLGKRGEKRWDNLVGRIISMFVRILTQTCAVKDRPFVGVMHAFIFWGFIFFMVATINHVGGAFFRGFSLWGRGLINDLWFFCVEIAAVFTIIGTVYMAVRRYLVRPESIKKPMPISSSPQSAVVLSLIFGLMVTYFLNQGSEIVLSGASSAKWMPVSRWTAGFLSGIPSHALHVWNTVFWWSHILMVLGFLFFIPHSKHLHLVAGPINLFFRSKKNIGRLEKIDLEATEQFGVTNVTDYSWKTLMDAFSCLECGRCQDQCPAYASGKPLSPKVVMMSLRKHLLHERGALLSTQQASEPVMDAWLTPDEIWACTTCGACMETCPVLNEHIPAIVGLRQAKVMMDSRFPQELNLAFKGLETNGNPWNMGAAGRADWTEGAAVKTLADNPNPEYLWFVGCAGAFDDKAKAASKAFAKILNTAGVNYSVLGTDEQCCGDPSRRAGNEYVFQMLAQANVEAFQSTGAKKVITACPHCFNMIKTEYPQFGGEFEVIHHSELIAQLIREGKLSVQSDGLGATSYHDSCYLGRYHQIYDAPREVMKSLSNGKFTELARNHDKSFCCGGGGGRMFMEEHGARINHLRIEEAAKAGVETLGVACPFCLAMLQDAVKEKGLDGIRVRDLAELVAERI
jgi:Fe-S oxidoreductase